jgi:hypothetical protein
MVPFRLSLIRRADIVNQPARLTSSEHLTPVPAPWSRQTVWETLVSAWHSSRLFAFTLLTIAVIVGAYYRFHQLDR